MAHNRTVTKIAVLCCLLLMAAQAWAWPLGRGVARIRTGRLDRSIGRVNPHPKALPNLLPRRGPSTKSLVIQALRGVTPKSDAVARAIEDGTVKVNILGDRMYRRAASRYTMNASGVLPGAFSTINGQIYVQRSTLRSAPQLALGQVVHEGTHVLDFKKVESGKVKRMSNWLLEKHGAVQEGRFLRAVGVPTMGASDLMRRIEATYRSDISFNHGPAPAGQ